MCLRCVRVCVRMRACVFKDCLDKENSKIRNLEPSS